MNKEEKLKDLCNNCQFNSEYCNIIKCNQYEKIAKEPNTKLNLYIVVDNSDHFVKQFDYGNLIPIKNWIENFLHNSNVNFESLCFYNNIEKSNEIIVNYGGLMYFVIKEESEDIDVSSII